MPATFFPTGSYSNLTRVQLEQLRKADFFAGSKALTVGDSGVNNDGTSFVAVGPGSINAEQFFTQQSTILDDVYGLTPAPQPGPGIDTQSMVGALALTSETTQWYGPTRVVHGTVGFGATGTHFQAGLNAFVGATLGDILLIKAMTNDSSPSGDLNTSVSAIVSSVTTTTLANDTLVLSQVVNPNYGTPSVPGTTLDFANGTHYTYVVVRPNAVKLFAYPGSGPGPGGQEQTFLTVIPTSTLHAASAPSTGQINADRILNIIPPNYNLNNPNPLNPSVDAADAVFGKSGPLQPLNLLGYRWVVYPDTGTGAPDLAHPITATSVINPGIPSTDQRFTFDFKAGIFRLSCAPALGGAFKVAGGVGPAGRLQLWAVFWAVDTTNTKGSARTLYTLRSTTQQVLKPGQVYFDTSNNAWRIGSSGGSFNDFFVQAQSAAEEQSQPTRWGAFLGGVGVTNFRGFTYRHPFLNAQAQSMFGTDSVTTVEVPVGEKESLSVSDMTAPPLNPALDYPPQQTLNSSFTAPGARDSFNAIGQLIQDVFGSGAKKGTFRRIHLRAGRYYANSTIVVPPGYTIEGDNGGTIISARGYNGSEVLPVFKFGANTTTGLYDFGTVSAANGAGPNLTPEPVFSVSPPFVSFNPCLEGMTTIWNPVRRVWACAYADGANNKLYFFEIDEYGSRSGGPYTFATGTLFTSNSSNGNFHTPNHYPRLAYHEHSDTYAMVWVEEHNISGTIGPQVKLLHFVWNALANANGAPASYPFGSTSINVNDNTNPYSDHPSVAIDNSNTSSVITWVSAWGLSFNSPAFAGPVINGSYWVTAFFTNGVQTQNPAFAQFSIIVSCTDIAADNQGGFLTAMCQRAHGTIFSTTGALTTTGTAQGTLTDSFPGGGNYYTYGFFGQSKVILLGVGGTSSGIDCLSTSNSSTLLDIVATENRSWSNFASGVHYAVVGASNIWVQRCKGSTIGDLAAIVTGQPDNNGYQTDTLEADYIKLSRGGPTGSNGFLLVYQAFNTTGFASRTTLKSFDDGFNHNFFYNTGSFNLGGALSAADPDLFREHISTCAVVLNDFGKIVYPAPPRELDVAAAGFTGQQSRELEVSLRSLGARAPVGARPNFYSDLAYSVLTLTGTVHFTNGSTAITGTGGTLFTTQIRPGDFIRYVLDPTGDYMQVGSIQSDTALTLVGPYNGTTVASTGVRTNSPYNREGRSLDRNISFLNFALRWPSGKVPSFFPEVSWTGEDWVVVSPCVDQIHSKAGTLFNNGGTYYLQDPLYYFGNDAANAIDGNYLKKTLGSDFVWFPAFNHASNITVYDEHTVQLTTPPTAITSGSSLTGVEWYLVKNFMFSFSNRTAGFKNPAFRVAPDGRVLVSSSFLTHCDEVPAQELPQPYDGAVNVVNRVQTLGWANTAPNEGNDGHLTPGSDITDPPDPESRIVADIGFHGVAAGAPKAIGFDTSTNGHVRQPMVAMAWGENSYGFMQWQDGGTNHITDAGNAAELEFFRQSFGPYHSSLRNLRIEGATSLVPGLAITANQRLKVLSSKKVFTRHPTNGNVTIHGYFATDGYRNCYVVNDTARSVFWPSNGLAWPVGLATVAYYTNALGDGAIRKQISNINNEEPSYVYGFEVADQAGYNPNIAKAEYSPVVSGPKVIWDGQHFVAAWTESWSNGSVSLTNICLSILPGDEDSGPQSLELLDPADNLYNPTMIETVRVTVGSSNNALFQLDIAHSGNTYAVLYTGTVDTQTTGGGSTVGVAIFDGAPAATVFGTAPPSGHNYGLQMNASQNVFTWPKIVWDGKQYVGVWVGSNQMFTQCIPEYGMARGTQIKVYGGAATTGTAQTAGALGVASSTDQLTLASAWASAAVQPGDVLVVTGYTGSPAGDARGMYLIQSYNPATRAVTIASEFVTAYFGSTSNVFGYIMGGSIGDAALFTGNNALSSMSTTKYNPAIQLKNQNGILNETTDTIAKINGLVYNESRDEYVVLYTAYYANNTTHTVIQAASFKRGQDRLSPARSLTTVPATTDSARQASIAWNGRNYCVILAPYFTGSTLTNDVVTYAILSPALAIEETATICTLVGTTVPLVGNNPGQVPGPGYGFTSAVPNSAALVQPHFRNVSVVWNPRMCRWAVSVEILWYNPGPYGEFYLTNDSLPNFSGSPDEQSTNYTFTTQTNGHGRIAPTSAGNHIAPQPGCKVFAESLNYQVGTATILEYSAGTFEPNVDLDRNTSQIAITSGGPNLFIAFREDVFCFTLGHDAPAVQIHDADFVSLENVTIGGGTTDIEELYTRMGRPIWQAGGVANGYIIANTQFQYSRGPQYNHRFMTPTLKTSMPRYSNVHSTTKYRFGMTMVSGDRTVDRYLYDGGNRRG